MNQTARANFNFIDLFNSKYFDEGITSVQDGDFHLDLTFPPSEKRHFPPGTSSKTRIVTSPKQLSVNDLYQLVRKHQRIYSPDEEFNIERELGQYSEGPEEIRWEQAEYGQELDHSLLLVAFRENECVGFASLGIKVAVDIEYRWVDAFLNLNLFYVLHQFRDLGFGGDLAVACGALGKDLYRVLSKSSPSGFELFFSVCAECVSSGGAYITSKVAYDVDSARDQFEDEAKEKNINTSPVRIIADLRSVFQHLPKETDDGFRQIRFPTMA